MGKSGKAKGKGGNKAELKAAKKAKLAAKAERKENKSTTGKGKGKGKAKDEVVDEEDLIQTLEEYRKRWQEEHKTTEESSETPSRRANATLTPCPISSNTLWLYGGEYFDGSSCYFYPELYRYNTEKNEWRKLTSPTQPSPRSAHQVVASPAGGGKLWVFGGEFSSLNQTSFHHYRDLWAFDITNRTWERYDTKVKPSARSGHRMALWKNYIVLFGGFHDVGIRTTYLADLWLWDTTEYRWHEVQIRDTDRRPQARSGFSFLPCADGIVLHGGYCKEYKGKQVKGVALDDTWMLRMDTDLQKIKWERRKKVGYAPSVRSGVQMAYWSAKAMGVYFGGVYDNYDAEEDDITSIFYNELFGYQLTGNGRWISLNLKKPKKKAGMTRAQKKKLQQKQEEALRRQKELEDDKSEGHEDQDDESTGSGSADESERKTNGIPQTREAPQDDSSSSDEEDDPDDPMKSVPIARYNAMMAVQKNTLYIYGGIVEAQNREYTLDDFYSLPLDKLDRFVCHKGCDIAELEWKESDSEDDSSGSDSDSESESDSDGEKEGDTVQETAPRQAGGHEERADPDGTEEHVEDATDEMSDLRKQATAFMGVAMNQQRSPEELLSTPLPGETLKTFYDRTREYWAQKAHEHSDSRGKELRRDGFQLAEEKYAVYKPVLEEIERIQAEAELDDVDIVKGGAKAGGLGVDSRNRR